MISNEQGFAAGLLQKISKQARNSKQVLMMPSGGTKSSWSCSQNMLLRVGGCNTNLKSPCRKSTMASFLSYFHLASMVLLQTLIRAGLHIFRATEISGVLRTGKITLSIKEPSSNYC